MKITSRFTVAVHTLLAIYKLGKEHKTTSEFIASSVNVNPVIIRRTLGSLKDAGIVSVKAGSGGATIIKPLEDITLLDVYRAVDSVEDGLFNFHDDPNPACPVGRNIHAVLDGRLFDAQDAMERELRNVSFADLVEDLKSYIE
jgi:Rrf2 family protein